MLAYLGLGSNLGDRAARLWEAMRRVHELPGTRLTAQSRLYETEPVGPLEQAWFLNAVVSVETPIEPLELLGAVKKIEGDMGRTPSERWGPRAIDIDILLYGDREIRLEGLVVPHVELWNRAFVLAPLADVLPRGHLAERVAARLAALAEGPTVRLYVPNT